MVDNNTTAKPFPIVHILPQAMWHDEAAIIGNEEGLRALRNAIDAALTREVARAEVFADDGEGYHAVIVRRHDMSDAPFGYTDKMCSGRKMRPNWLRSALDGR